jgi:hypothetical protein
MNAKESPTYHYHPYQTIVPKLPVLMMNTLRQLKTLQTRYPHFKNMQSPIRNTSVAFYDSTFIV